MPLFSYLFVGCLSPVLMQEFVMQGQLRTPVMEKQVPMCVCFVLVRCDNFRVSVVRCVFFCGFG